MIGYIFFRIAVGFFRILPWGAVYLLADFVYFVLYRVIRYRVDLVKTNLSLCFPEKDEAWVEDMSKKYFRYLADIFLESIKALHISAEELQSRYRVRGENIMHNEALANRNVILLSAHYGNWEFMTRGLSFCIPHEVAGIYSPLSNKRIEAYMAKCRSQDGMWLVPAKESKEAWTADRGNPVAYTLLSDQNPSNPDRAYWINFLHRETGFIPGAEVYAKRYDYPVVLMLMHMTKRGYYEITFELISDRPNETEFGEIMCKYAAKLEDVIRENPALWLWTHRRWKHKKPEAYTPMDPIRE